MEENDFFNNDQSDLGLLLKQLHFLMKKGRWSKAKIKWLAKYCGFSSPGFSSDTWDIYGSEHEMFMPHLGDKQICK